MEAEAFKRAVSGTLEGDPKVSHVQRSRDPERGDREEEVHQNISYLVGALDNERDMANPKVHNFQGPTEAADWNKAPVVWKIGAHDNGQRCLWELFAGRAQ